MSCLGGNEDSDTCDGDQPSYRGDKSRPLSSNTMLHALEELESRLAAQQEALSYTRTESRYNSVRVGEFHSQMSTLPGQLVDMLSDSAGAARHARRGTSIRQPGPLPANLLGLDTDCEGKRRVRVVAQRRHLRDEIEELRQAEDLFSRQAGELDGEVGAVGQAMEEIHAEVERLRSGVEEGERRQCCDDKQAGGEGIGGGGSLGGGLPRPEASSDLDNGGGWSGGSYEEFLGYDWSPQKSTNFSSK